MGRCQAIGTFLDCIAVGRIYVAHGQNLVKADLVCSIEKDFHPLSGPDDSEPDCLVRAEDAG